ncbi:lysophospholipase [Polaribacter sp. MSW13]|uniref:Lysophospholipase n=1 Tax=Polaribacter marinus TaxID=2916838 RepID=A0A9X1VNY4_9FLAO|nr:alpha/beta fold hydrolase [Polaribacter marinus]MCI2230044.1 lysophospholipase [Polaribacter marinus]
MKEKIKFKNNQGQHLAALLEFPDEKIIGYAIFAHCFTCNKNLTAVRNIGKALNSKGIAVFRFDFTGLGESEGDFEDTNFTSNVDDLIAAADYLKTNYKAPSILIGHSLGGAAVLFAKHQIPSIKAVVTIGAPSNPSHVSHLFSGSVSKIIENGEAELSIGGRPFKIKEQFLNDIKSKKIEKVTVNLNVPLLIFHSPIDTTVEIENAAKIYKSAKHPKSFISLDKADHLLSNKEDSEFVGLMISVWSKRYLND